MVKSIPHLPLPAIYPPAVDGINLNTCGDPDCGNFGVPPDFTLPSLRGRGAAGRRAFLAASTAALSVGIGRYGISGTGNANLQRVSRFLEYEGDPHAWEDGRSLICRHQRGNGECRVGTIILSNAHLAEERRRLASSNGILDGPHCGACGRRYLDAPEEFLFNGVQEPRPKNRAKPGVRLIHRPCRGKPGARFTVSVEHGRQKDRRDNIRILAQIVNGAGINDLRRLLAPASGGRSVSIKRIYDRIFWLQRVLLAYEAAQLKLWRARLAAEGTFRHTRIAHDDVVLGVNWETSADRRITALNCSVSADIASGYVFRIDVDFDPGVDPVAYVKEVYLGATGRTPALRSEYRQPGGRAFTAPLLAFQRPSGRYDEAALFASAELHLRLFATKATDALSRAGAAPSAAAKFAIMDAEVTADVIGQLGRGYFDFPFEERDGRNTFTGIMTRDIYTKAAHLACLRDLLPKGKMTLVSEQEAAMARVVPHIFRDMIRDDRFEWAVITFDKAASKPKILARTTAFQAAFRAFRGAHPALSPSDALQAFVVVMMGPAFHTERAGNPLPIPGSNFGSRAFPALWMRSPLQVAGETEKSIGFPILSPRYRAAYRAHGFQNAITDPTLREAIARRVVNATIQPAATFMNALRERVSFARRAGGRSARTGPSFVNGACYNPAVLIAVLDSIASTSTSSSAGNMSRR
jgi:hypothetical protein